MPAIRSARRMLEDNGAEVLGLVLNKRRLHVPQAVYDRL
jgi:Mrp family chromosome partitioning ATPase